MTTNAIEVPQQVDVANLETAPGSMCFQRLWPGVVCCSLYVLLAIATYGSGSLSSTMVGIKWNDTVEQIWWLGWTAHALPNVHSLFLTNGQNYPYGQNFGVNGSMLALGTLFAPITRVFGPVVSYNVLLRLALASSAASMCFVLRRWTKWWPAAFVGGLLYGFSAYISNFAGYLFLIFVPLPPLILMVLHEMFVRQKWRAGVTGILLGVLCALQFFIWVEVLAGTLVIGTLGVAVLLVVTRDQFANRWRYAVTSIAYFLGAVCLLLAYPLVFTFSGPQAINGSPEATPFLGLFNTDLLSPLMANGQWLVPGVMTGSSDNALYVGLPLLIVLACFAVLLRRRRALLFAGAMAVMAFILSLGSRLTVNGHTTSVPLPFSLFVHLPALSGFEARRFALYTDLFLAAMFAIGIDEIWRRTRTSLATRPARHWNTALGVIALGALMFAVVLPLVPKSTPSTTSTNVPKFFTSRAVDAIPSGSVVLAYPYPDFVNDDYFSQLIRPIDSVMLDQAVSGMRFKLIGGFGWFPSASGEGGTSDPAQLEPKAVQALFDGESSVPQNTLTKDLRTFLQRYDVQSVVVVPIGHVELINEPLQIRPTTVVSHLTAAIGQPEDVDGVKVWLHVGQRLADKSVAKRLVVVRAIQVPRGREADRGL